MLDKARQVRTWPVTAGTFSRLVLTALGKAAYVDPCQRVICQNTMVSWLHDALHYDYD